MKQHCCPVCLSVCLSACRELWYSCLTECWAQSNVAREGKDINTTTRGRVLIYNNFYNQLFKITRHVICPPYHRDNLTPSPLNHHLILKPSHPSSSSSSWSLLSSPSLNLTTEVHRRFTQRCCRLQVMKTLTKSQLTRVSGVCWSAQTHNTVGLLVKKTQLNT